MFLLLIGRARSLWDTAGLFVLTTTVPHTYIYYLFTS